MPQNIEMKQIFRERGRAVVKDSDGLSLGDSRHCQAWWLIRTGCNETVGVQGADGIGHWRGRYAENQG